MSTVSHTVTTQGQTAHVLPPQDAGRTAKPSKTIAIMVGEVSGDQLGVGLMRALKAKHPDTSFQFVGIGGELMRAEGMTSWFDAEELAVMGLAEVLRHLPRLLKRRKQATQALLAAQADVVIGIDAPDFTLKLEQRCKQAGMKTLHYVSPSIWAWRPKRAERIIRSCNEVLCLFPMEPPLYHAQNMAARFVGHPLADAMPQPADQTGARDALGLSPTQPVLALLPGSRLSELKRLAPDFLRAAERLCDEIDGLTVLVPAANRACHDFLREQLTEIIERPQTFHLLNGHASLALRAADQTLIASGTAALEAMCAGTPMVVAYRVAPLTHWVVRAFNMLKTPWYSLPNVLANERLVPELMQDDCNVDAMVQASMALWHDESRRTAMRERFAQLHQQLALNADEQAADAVWEHLNR